MDEDSKNKILQYESRFKYSRGVLRTPQKWRSYFWSYYRDRTNPFLKRKISEHGTVVVVGIGTGDVVSVLDSSEREKIVGVDINLESLFLAREKTNVIMADGASLPFRNNSVDLIICNMVLHHIVGQGTLDFTISECYRVLKEGGEFVTIEPNSLHPSGALMNLLNRFQKYHFLAGGSDYEFSISPFYIKKLLKNRKFCSLSSFVVTFSHPRLPICIQKFINLFDKRLSKLCFAGLINIYTAEK